MASARPGPGRGAEDAGGAGSPGPGGRAAAFPSELLAGDRGISFFFFIFNFIFYFNSPFPAPRSLQGNSEQGTARMLSEIPTFPRPHPTNLQCEVFCQRPHWLQLVASNNPAKKYCTDKIYKYIYIYNSCK